MIWIIILVIGIGIMVFWPVYDRIKWRKAEIQTDLGLPGETTSSTWIKHAVWDCPVCGKNHDGRKTGRASCPFEDGSYFPVWKEQLLDYEVTSLGGAFELPYLAWEYDDKVYLTYRSNTSAVLKDQYGQIYANAYYSALFCRKEEWDPYKTKREINLAVKELRDRVLNSMYESEEHYIVGLDRILDMSVTREASCAETGYVIWRGEQGIYVTGIRTGASIDIFNYDRISRSNAVHRFDKPYTRRLCGTLDELREMPQDEIDAQAYGAYMDGAK
ncbi:MAG: hypothetical protein IKG67_15115 [Parasporobacterium sp.]|nr:hypothetical protein [Parasporobacterium sp.]